MIAVTLWAAVYAAIGVAGTSIFPQAWQGVVAAVVLVIVFSLLPTMVERWRARRSRPASASDPVPPR